MQTNSWRLFVLGFSSLLRSKAAFVPSAVKFSALTQNYSRLHRRELCCAIEDSASSSSAPVLGDVDHNANSTGASNENTQQRVLLAKKKKGPKIHPKKERPRIPVLQYHDNWVIVNKPAGMTVHRSGKTPRSQLVLSTLLKRQFSRKTFPVHRLDHRTSGAILFAFDSKTCGLLHNSLTSGNGISSNSGEFDNDKNEEEQGDGDGDVDASNHDSNNNDDDDDKNRGSQKEYIALLRGDWKDRYGEQTFVTVTKPLDVKGVSKSAETEFNLLASYGGPPGSTYHPSACSLVLCKPKTGRTHQIRRHAYAISFPVLGDSEHGDSKVNRWWRENRDLNRLFLHSFCLDLPPIQEGGDDESNKDETKVLITGNSGTNKDNGESMNRIYCVAPLLPELLNVLQRDDMVDNIWNDAIQNDPRLQMECYDQRGGTFGRHYKAG